MTWQSGGGGGGYPGVTSNSAHGLTILKANDTDYAINIDLSDASSGDELVMHNRDLEIDTWVVGAEGYQLLNAGIGLFGHASPASASAITGALSTVTDAAAKAVLTSIIAALIADGGATNGTT